MLRSAIRKTAPGQTRLPFALHVRTDNRAARLARLIAPCGPRDMDDPQPGIRVVEAGISHRIWSLQKIARLSD